MKSCNRNPSVELARIIACYFVLCIHTYLPLRLESQYNIGRLFYACLVADAVAVFWLITGCFLFASSMNDYGAIVRKNVKKVVLPALLFGVFCFYFAEWVINPSISLSESISHSAADYYNVFIGGLSLFPVIGCTGHFWYIYTHILLILIFPVIKLFVDYLDKDTKRYRYYCIVSCVLFVINDFTSNTTFGFSHHSINALFPAAIYVIWGHILYRYRERFKSYWYAFYSLAVYVLLNGVRTMIQMTRFNGNDSLLYWFSSIGLLSSIHIVIFCLSIRNLLSKKRIYRGICFISKYTFEIYIIQYLFIDKFISLGMTTWLQTELFRAFDKNVSDLLYMFIMPIAVFFTTLTFLIFLHFAFLWLRRIWKYFLLRRKRNYTRKAS